MEQVEDIVRKLQARYDEKLDVNQLTESQKDYLLHPHIFRDGRDGLSSVSFGYLKEGVVRVGDHHRYGRGTTGQFKTSEEHASDRIHSHQVAAKGIKPVKLGPTKYQFIFDDGSRIEVEFFSNRESYI